MRIILDPDVVTILRDKWSVYYLFELIETTSRSQNSSDVLLSYLLIAAENERLNNAVKIL